MSDKKANVKGFFKRFKENREQKEEQMRRTQREKDDDQKEGGKAAALMTRVSRDTAKNPQVSHNMPARSNQYSDYNLSPVNFEEVPAMLPKRLREHHNKNLLVLDLDETLVHSSFKPVQNPNTILPISIDGQLFSVYVKKRPFLDEFMRKIQNMFEVCVFTASLSKYADPLLDELDPGRRLMGGHRLFREHCSHTNGVYVKDLSLMGRPLERIVIIDNSPVAYLFQPRNALPCTSWFDDPNDTELYDFFSILERLAATDNVYPILDEFMETM